MLPPFYYKNVSDDGVFAAYADVIEQVGDARLKVYLYHFPQMSGVALGPVLIERLLKQYPDTIAGMKDSSGSFSNMVHNTNTFPGFAVISGSDEFLLPLLKEGGAGCITAVSNVAVSIAAEVHDAWAASDLDAAEAGTGPADPGTASDLRFYRSPPLSRKFWRAIAMTTIGAGSARR